MVVPGEAVFVRSSDRELRVDPCEIVAPTIPASSGGCGVVNRRDGDLVQAGAPSTSMIADCVAVPAATDPRLKELAAQLGEGANSPEERIERTIRFLQRTCHYSLDVGAFHSRQPVAEFVFEKKKGYCEYFASAATLLLRLEGIPARYVTGYNVGAENRPGDHYVVRELDAHAWVEAYVPGRGWPAVAGWLEIDPTPEAEYLSLHRNLEQTPWSDISEWMEAKLVEVRMWWRPRDWLARLGRLRRRWLLPLEHVASLPADALSSTARPASVRAIESFYRCAFGGVRLSEEDLRELRRSVQALETARAAPGQP